MEGPPPRFDIKNSIYWHNTCVWRDLHPVLILKTVSTDTTPVCGGTSTRISTDAVVVAFDHTTVKQHSKLFIVNSAHHSLNVFGQKWWKINENQLSDHMECYTTSIQIKHSNIYCIYFIPFLFYLFIIIMWIHIFKLNKWKNV